MTHEGSESEIDVTSSPSSVIKYDLFPSFHRRSKPKNARIRHYEEQEYIDTETDLGLDSDSHDEDNSSSIKKLRNMFANTNQKYDSSNIPSSCYSFTSDVAKESSDDQIFFDDSIIHAISQRLAGETENCNGKLKYLELYESIRKEKEREGIYVENSDRRAFDFSVMDDFDKFIKQTEIDNAIHAKVESEKILPNLLNVVQSIDLADNFYVHDNFENENVKKSNKLKSLWRNMDSKMQTTNTSDFELYLHDTSSSNDDHHHYLARKLKIRHLQMISFGGTIGVGFFLNIGKAFTIAGGLGTFLAFFFCGLVVLSTVVSFCEMVTFVSVVDGVSGLSSRFVDDSFGFAVGWLYFFSFGLGLSGEIVASVILLTYYSNLNILSDKGSSAGFVTLFLILIVLSNLIDVRIYGEIEYITSFIKLIVMAVLVIIMIVMNRGGFGSEVLGFKYWTYSKSDFAENIIFGAFRPSFNLHSTGTDPPSVGIGGDKGRFMSLMVAILVTSYAYSGTETVCIAACEAKSPRLALPSATRRVFWRVIFFYCLSAFVVSLNIYAGDPRLLRYYSGGTGVSVSELSQNVAVKYVGGDNCHVSSTVFAGYGSGSQSPWIAALQSAGLCEFTSVLNGFLVFFAVTCGNSQLYVSSRTIYSLALQGKAPKCLTLTTKYGIPYLSVLFAASFGLVSYVCVSEKATVVFQNLTSIIASSGIMVWFAMCLSFLRFFYGLKKRPDIISREDKAYPYRSPFQPFTAIFGLFGSAWIILTMGYTVFLHDEWSVLSFFTSYGTLILFVILYFGHRSIKHTRIPSLETMDFDSGRREMDRYIWDGGREYNAKSLKETAQKWISFLA